MTSSIRNLTREQSIVDLPDGVIVVSHLARVAVTGRLWKSASVEFKALTVSLSVIVTTVAVLPALYSVGLPLLRGLVGR